MCFRPDDPHKAIRGASKGKLRTIASNGHKLVSMIGGTWEGEWPTQGRDVVLVPSLFSRKRAKGILDTEITVQAFPDGSVNVLDDAADHQAVGESCFKHYPDVDTVLQRYRRYAITKEAIGLNAAYLEEMGRIGQLFQDHAFNRMRVLLRRRNMTKKGEGWCPVFDATAESMLSTRRLDVLLMGLRADA